MKKMLKIFEIIIFIFVIHNSCMANELLFSDISEGQWYYDAILEMKNLGIINGYPDGTFQPDKDISRIELASLAFKALPMKEQNELSEEIFSEIETQNSDYWAKDIIKEAYMREITAFGTGSQEWDQIATREEMAYIFVKSYTNKPMEELDFEKTSVLLIGDYEDIKNSEWLYGIVWLYTKGIITGTNEQGNFEPNLTATRAQACTILERFIFPEKQKKYDWENLEKDYIEKAAKEQLKSEIDFTGSKRIKLEDDVAFDYCRQLEEEIGIQIFYIPEWTEKSAGMFNYEYFSQFNTDKIYFELVLEELKKMKATFDHYPKGFLKELISKKSPGRGTEIILCPYAPYNLLQFGMHVYDYSDDEKKVDQVYCTGIGDEYFYSHEMGHMILSCMAIRNGWSDTNEKWQTFSKENNDYVSDYAMVNRPEDWAETWAYLWHYTSTVKKKIDAGGSGLKDKVIYLTEIMDKYYDTVNVNELPWNYIINEK